MPEEEPTGQPEPTQAEPEPQPTETPPPVAESEADRLAREYAALQEDETPAVAGPDPAAELARIRAERDWLAQQLQRTQAPRVPDDVGRITTQDDDEPVTRAELRAHWERARQQERNEQMQAQRYIMQQMLNEQNTQQLVARELDRYAITDGLSRPRMRATAENMVYERLAKIQNWSNTDLAKETKRVIKQLDKESGFYSSRVGGKKKEGETAGVSGMSGSGTPSAPKSEKDIDLLKPGAALEEMERLMEQMGG